MAIVQLSDLFIYDKEKVDLQDIFLNAENRKMITDLLREYRYAEALAQYGLPVNNKILLYGESGCGKTTTAKGIASALEKPLMVVNLSQIIHSKIGETAQNMKALFDKAIRDKAVLFLDEFDQLGKARVSADTDVGEMKRLVNSIIQLIDYLPFNTLLICATNHVGLLDIALLRRFQIRIAYDAPSEQVLDEYYNALLSKFPGAFTCIERKYGVSFAEAKDIALTQVKAAVLNNLDKG